MKPIILKALAAIVLLMVVAACKNGNEPVVQEENPVYVMTGFARGADVSWLTQMEAAGKKFYSSAGRDTECMSLLRDLGLNSVRLRVWVNPSDGWCNTNDVVTKAVRADRLGMRVMIDFHYSDSWADPLQQYKPAAWKDMSADELKAAVANHTKDVLNALKAQSVVPEWVQVGNEVGAGMLWDTDAVVSGATYDVDRTGQIYRANEANFAAFVTAGCDAAKDVFPDAKVIVHLQNGHDRDLYIWIFDMLQKYSARYDVIGMSLYPAAGDWQSKTSACIANMKELSARYGKEVMVCEVGMPWDQAATAKAFLTELITKSKELSKCLGVFYWEPQSYGNWNGYTLGAFDDSGKPTAAMDAFR